MADKTEAPRKPGKKPEVIDLCDDSDGAGKSSGTPVRNDAASNKQKRTIPGFKPKTVPSHTGKHQTASKRVDATPRAGSTSIHSSSQNSQAQQQPRKSILPANNSTLAQRAASRGSEAHDPPSSHRVSQTTSSSNDRARSPPASQVQISRGTSSTMLSGMSSSNASPGPAGKVSSKKRRHERDGAIREAHATKKLKPSQGQGQSISKRSATLSGTYQSSGAGSNGKPIVIPDSPPPSEVRSIRREASPRPERPKTPKQPKTLASKTAGRASVSSTPKLQTADLARPGSNRREAVEHRSNHGSSRARSPTIPESPPGSPLEKNASKTDTCPRSPSLPLFVRPSDSTDSEPLNPDVETISSFAQQAEAILASQTDDPTADVTASRVETPHDDREKPSPALNRQITPHSAVPSNLAPAPKDTTSPTTQDRPGRISSTGSAHDRPSVSASTSSGRVTPANHVERVITKYAQELRSDNVYWTRTLLRWARSRVETPRKSSHTPTSAFRDLKPLEFVQVSEDESMSDTAVRFAVENTSGGGKGSHTSYLVPCTMYKTSTHGDVPDYSHFVNLKHSFLAQNVTVLQHWPYFHDDFEIKNAVDLDEQYYLDVKARERKIKCLAQAENYAEYVEDMLSGIECTWSDVLRFLLDPKPDVGTNLEALAALQKRDKYCDEDFVRGGQRWTTVLSQLPASSDPDRIGRAALLCQYFKKIAKFQLWHVARRSAYTAKLLEETDPIPNADEITCRVCMRFNCPFHGEIHEGPSDESDSEQETFAAEEVVETDIINPHRVNYRSRMEFPPTVEARETDAVIDPKRKRVEYWNKLNLNHYPEERPGPFYPCYHPGTSCDKTQCPCYQNRIPCEKSCSCEPGCKHKWQGCDCRMKGAMICFEDQRCACFQYGRECDADLCGECGVIDVLDPVHRHDETILKGRCHNASIQRGVPRHTILGKSGIHGLGLYACEDIKHHDFVGEYKGEIITEEEAERRGAVYEHQKLSYLFTLNRKQGVDSTLFGNKVRFINHASEKQANIYPRIIMVNTVFRIALYGARDIKAGQELFFDYGPQFPQDQLGFPKSKANKERKAAPHVRNKNLIAEFDEIGESVDKFGNRRAVKTATAAGDRRGKLASKSSGSGPGGHSSRERSLVARKSTALQPPPKRSGVQANRSRSDRSADHEQARNPFDDMDLDAGQRLSSYNVADEDDRAPVLPNDDDDEDFDPRSERSGDDRALDETSSIDGDDEDEDDDEVVMHTRPRSSRRRR